MKYRTNAHSAEYEAVSVLNNPMLFTASRIDPKTVPGGLHLYHVRHHSECLESPIQICDSVVVNFFGSLLSSCEIELEKHPVTGVCYRSIDPEADWDYSGYTESLEDYLRRVRK